MVCEACGGRTQRETVVLVRRSFGTVRSTTRDAWYCWTCRASTGLRRVDAPVPPQACGARLSSIMEAA